MLGKLLLIVAAAAFAGPEAVGAGPAPAATGYQLYVSSTGSDADSGAFASPFASLEKARDAIRALKGSGGLPPGGVTVWIRGGTYHRSGPLLMDSADSASAGSPVVYRAYGNERVVFTGARPLLSSSPVTDPAILRRLPGDAARSKVRVFDLSALAVADYGDLDNRGIHSAPRPWMVELFYDDRPMPLARWPNEDFAYTVSPVPGRWKESQADSWFSYREDNPSRWLLSEGVWLHGRWTYWWADSIERLVSVDAAARRFETAKPGIFGYSADQPYTALNVLEELDRPGEWVIDHARHTLYFWPPDDAKKAVTLSLLAQPFISLNRTQHVSFRNLIFEQTRSSGVEMHNTAHVLIAGCVFRNLGNLAVTVGNGHLARASREGALDADVDTEGGHDNGVTGSEIYNTGEGGIALSGGDVRMLRPANNFAHNNYIHNFSRSIKNYRPAVSLYGVGNRASHNTIHTSPHAAIFFDGNDHTIERNHIYDVLLETDDGGAIYAVQRDWKRRGTVIRHNKLEATPRAYGIYLDDFTSGTLVHDNIVLFSALGVLVGGGRDNTVRNNLIVGYGNAGWCVSARGVDWAKGSIPNLTAAIQHVARAPSPYVRRYPPLLDILRDEPALPKGTVFANNLFLNAGPGCLLDFQNDAQKRDSITVINSMHYAHYDPGFVDPDAVRKRKFELRRDSEPILNGFVSISDERIGVQEDEYGTVSPGRLPPWPRPYGPRRPFHGDAIRIVNDTILQAEDFDRGGESHGYHTAAIGNSGAGLGRYRTGEDVAIWGRLENGMREYAIALAAGEWTEYTVEVLEPGAYGLQLRFAGMRPSRLRLHLDNVNAAGTIELPHTSGNDTYDALMVPNTIRLPPGVLRLRVVAETELRLDSIRFVRITREH